MSAVVPGLLPWHLDAMTTSEVMDVMRTLAARAASSTHQQP